jgi:regulator of CtrA degradation
LGRRRDEPRARGVAQCAQTCHVSVMHPGLHDSTVQRRLIDALYVESMLLADEARSYFDEGGRVEREALEPMARVSFSCESLKVTTRLMHVIAWLLTQRAVMAGELRPRDALDPSRRLGEAPATDPAIVRALPEQARMLIASSADLHRRVARLDAAQAADAPGISPARSMLDRLAMAF